MTRISRRGLLGTGAAASVLAATGLAVAAQQRGGTLRMAVSGASTSDSWDCGRFFDIFMIAAGPGAVLDTLTEVAANGEMVGELASSWEASPDAKTWVFHLRKGVEFHNGKSFGADDVIATFQHFKADDRSSARTVVNQFRSFEKLGSHSVQIVLNEGNADLPFLLAGDNMCIYPAGNIKEAMRKGIGTGLYRVERFEPGIRLTLSRVNGHYKDGRAGWFDAVEIFAISDPAARSAALSSGEVDVLNNVDIRAEPSLRGNGSIRFSNVTGNRHYSFPMNTTKRPFDDVRVRQALKHAVDRQAMVDRILSGRGSVANDIPIGPANQYFAAHLPVNNYDPDRAKFLLRQAGHSNLNVDLSVADAAFPGAIDAAKLYKTAARAAGITINVVQEPNDGYWSNVWLKKAWCASYWSGRPTEDAMFSTAYASGAPWNETFWRNTHFNSLLVSARSELEPAKRRDMYHEMQSILSSDGGAVIPMYANYVDAYSNRLAHSGTVGNLNQLDSGRLIERWWFA